MDVGPLGPLPDMNGKKKFVEVGIRPSSSALFLRGLRKNHSSGCPSSSGGGGDWCDG